MAKKKKEKEEFSNKQILILTIAITITLAFMYYIGIPWLNEANEKEEYRKQITEECFIEYAKNYCMENNMSFDRIVDSWGNFYCLSDEYFRDTGRTKRFYFKAEELKHCKNDVFEVADVQ